MHITSLPSPYGIGTMGREAYKFIDFLKASGQTYWQILPIGPTSYGDSPYQSFSTYAGNPYLIDLDLLEESGYLQKSEYQDVFFGTEETSVDYGALYENRYPILEKAVKRLWEKETEFIEEFCEKQNFWIEEYALFMSLKHANQGQSWLNWEEPIRLREEKALEEAKITLAEEIRFWKGIQYFFFLQWNQLKAYANDKGVQMIGDIPIYVALDSVDVWANPQEFQLDPETMYPIEVAGCPPDGFTADGQLWGNPLFDWAYMEEDGFTWWLQRIKTQCAIFDMVRIDHFRGFDEYYAIPFTDVNARNGRWKPGPGIKLFEAVKAQIGEQNIIAEDLGFLTDSVRTLLEETGYPGMKVMLFGFNPYDSGTYLPHSYIKNSIAYIGTHDNETIMSWLEHGPQGDIEKAFAYLRLQDGEPYNWGFMRNLWGSVSDLTIVQMQDILGEYGRMNTPSTPSGNWQWRMKSGKTTEELSEKLIHTMRIYERV